MIEGRRVRPWDSRGLEGDDPELPDSIWGHWHDDKNGAWVLPERTSYSDYSGSLIERSNLEVFKEEFAEYEDVEWVAIHGGHGTKGLLVRVDADERVPEIGEFFEKLENNYYADENHHSNLEQEVEQEDWANYGRKDFVRWLQRAEGVEETFSDEEWEQIIDGLTDEQLDDIWWDAVSNGNGEEVRHEGNEGTHFNFEGAFRDISLEAAIRDAYKEEDWGRLFADHIWYRFQRGNSLSDDPANMKRIEALPAETKSALWGYFSTRAINNAPLGVAFPTFDILRSWAAFELVLRPTQNWSSHDWSVFLDTLEEEGPAAFEPGHAGRRFGRR